MKVSDIAKVIEKLAPKEFAYDFDNVGLLVGDENGEVKKIMLCLDMDENVAGEAAEIGADLVLGHHPVMFEPIKQVTAKTGEGRAIMTLIKNNISYYAAHTNMDVAKGGLNDLLAEKLGVLDTKALSPIHIEGEGIGRIGFLSEETTLGEFMQKCKAALNCDGVRFSGDKNAKIRKIAVNTGGGTSLIADAIKEKADVFVTGDFRYNQIRDCAEANMNIIDIGHYNTEVIIEELYEKMLRAAFGGNIEIAISKKGVNVMSFA